MLTVQVESAANVAPQVVADWTKSPGFVPVTVHCAHTRQHPVQRDSLFASQASAKAKAERVRRPGAQASKRPAGLVGRSMREHNWFRRLPDWLVSCRADWLRPDIVAGLTTGAVIIPKAMAYAMMSGLPVQVGLYTALVPMAIYAVLGTSRVLSVSTTTTLAILTAAQLGQAVPDGNPAALLKASATLTLLVGAALLLACLLRLGTVANFISEPVLVGFRAGIGLVIVVDQIPKVLGIHFVRGTFVQNVLSILHSLPKTSLATLAVGLTIIVALLSLEHFLPKLPAPVNGIRDCADAGRRNYGTMPILSKQINPACWSDEGMPQLRQELGATRQEL